jgi:hypothetical protein
MQKTTFKSVLSLMALIVLSAFMSIGFQSCSKADDDDGDSGESSFVGKWTVSSPSAEYGSFEFTGDKKYIITQRTTTPPSRSANTRSASTRSDVYIIIIFGDISSLTGSGNEYTLNLSEFGTITIHIGSNGTATVTVNGETYTTKKENEVEVSDKTELLCHTWENTLFNGYITLPGDKVEIYTSDMIEGTITFAKSGTCYSYGKWYDWSDEHGNYDPNYTYEKSGYGTWRWNNKEQTEVYIPFEEEYEYESDDIYHIHKILKLSNDSLIVQSPEWIPDTGEICGYDISKYCRK